MSRLVLIKTCQRFRDRREACEQTWAGELRSSGVPVYYVEGGHRSLLIRDDVIQIPGGDAYNDNSYKVRDGLEAVLETRLCSFVFVADDNTFVHPARWLAYQPEGEFVGLRYEAGWVCGGAGWYMSRRACELYCEHVTRRFSGDDVIASEILERNDIKLIDRPDLFSQEVDRVSRENALITCHNVDPNEMRELYAATHGL